MSPQKKTVRRLVTGGRKELEETYPGRSHSPVCYHVPEVMGKQNNTGRPWEPLAGRGVAGALPH